MRAKNRGRPYHKIAGNSHQNIYVYFAFLPPALNTTLFSSFLGASWISRQKSQDIPPEVCFPQFQGAYRSFWPQPLDMEDPHPTKRYLDPKFEFVLLFQGTEKLPPPPPREQEKKSREGNFGAIQPYDRYGSAVASSKTISTIAILWPVKAIFEKRATMVEVDAFIYPVFLA